MKAKYHHQDLASGRWFELSLVEQLVNIGSKVERTNHHTSDEIWRKYFYQFTYATQLAKGC